MKKAPFYTSVKKTLGVIGFFFYWILQFYVVFKNPEVVKDFIMPDVILVSTLLGIKTIGGVLSSRKEQGNE